MRGVDLGIWNLRKCGNGEWGFMSLFVFEGGGDLGIEWVRVMVWFRGWVGI